MKFEEIEKFMKKKGGENPAVQINFKTRKPLVGLFIKTADYDELSRKNFWRIVIEEHISSYKESKNESLAKIFHGAEFTKLS